MVYSLHGVSCKSDSLFEGSLASHYRGLVVVLYQGSKWGNFGGQNGKGIGFVSRISDVLW